MERFQDTSCVDGKPLAVLQSRISWTFFIIHQWIKSYQENFPSSCNRLLRFGDKDHLYHFERDLADAVAASLARICAHDIAPRGLEDVGLKDTTKIKSLT